MSDLKHGCVIRSVQCILRELREQGSQLNKKEIDRAVDLLSSLETQTHEANLNALFNQSADPIMTLAPPSWRFTGCNPSALRFFEVPDESTFIQLGPWDLSPESQPDKALSSEKASQMIVRAMEEGSQFFEWEHQTLGGKKVSCTVLLSRVDVQGSSYLQATVRDVSTERLLQQALSQRTQDLEGILFNAPVGIVRFDSAYCYISVNAAYEQFLGYTEAELKCRTMLDLTHPDDRQMTLSKILELKNSNKDLNVFEKRYIHKSGEVVWGRVTTRVYLDKSGKVRFLAIIEDVTDLQRVTREVANVFVHSRDLLCIAGVDGTFKRVSPSFKKLLGWSDNDLLSQSFSRFIHSDDCVATAQEIEKLASGLPTINFENRFRTKDGSYRMISWVAEPDPSMGLVYATGRDVTELRETEVRNQQIFNALDHAAIIAFTDTRGKITRVNDNFCKISGYSREELIGKDHRMINSGRHSKEFFAELWKTIKLGKAWTGDIQNTKKTGEIYHVRSLITPLVGVNGSTNEYMALRFDITENVKLREQVENERIKLTQNAKLASLGELSAGIAHEINNPLAVIMGSLRLLTKFKDSPEKFKSKVNSLEKSVYRIEKIVKGLKKFSRESSETEHKSESLKDILLEVVTLTEAKAKMHGTLLSVKVDESLRILCDVVEIEQVFLNLINNAVDAVAGQVEKWVEIRCFSDSQSIVVQVIDSGPGISSELEAKLFQPFFTTKPVGQGTGLGLSISKGILDQHDASISINRDFKNTCFEMRFKKVEDLAR